MTESEVNPVYQIVAEKSKQKIANDRKHKSTPEAEGEKVSILKRTTLSVY